MGSTKIELVTHLRGKPPCPAREALIARALEGHYHDFESPSGMPKVQLFIDLTAAKYLDLADRVRRGEYDEEPTPEQLEELREELLGRGPP